MSVKPVKCPVVYNLRKMMNHNFFYSIILLSIFFSVECGEFDRYSGLSLEKAVVKEYRPENATSFCNINVKPCTPHEGSRIDGTCNNFRQPTRGSAIGPYLRLLRPDYADGKKIRSDKHGSSLPSARLVRTALETTGRVDKTTLTIAAPTMLIFIQRDISFTNETNFVLEKPNCCNNQSKMDPECIPIEVPKDDPYLKVTGIKCLNATRVETFQGKGCTLEGKAMEQINYQTPVIDLSTIYGVDEDGLAKVRAEKHGLLKLARRNHREVPLNLTDGRSICSQNEGDAKVCYQFGFPEAGNFGLRVTTFGIFFMREHNRIATALYKINPCWKDDRLFKVARQINIATAANIYLYELLPIFLGFKNMNKFNLFTGYGHHVDIYNDKAPPLVVAEFDIAMRYFHTLLDGRVKLYSEKYHYKKQFSYSETLFKQGLIELDKNFEHINRGTFHQQCGKNDDIQDPDISETYYGRLQNASDLPALDIQRGRDFGIRGYNDYRHYCGRTPAKKFEDLLDVMEVEKLEELKHLYKDVDDIDLLAGIKSESFVHGATVGPTLFCIMLAQLKALKYSDRFWFERGDQVHSFRLDQLNEVRKTSIARLACDNAEGIKSIQPNAFINVLKDKLNAPIPCSHIPGLDLDKWRDHSCSPLGSSHNSFGFSFENKHNFTEFAHFFSERLH